MYCIILSKQNLEPLGRREKSALDDLEGNKMSHGLFGVKPFSLSLFFEPLLCTLHQPTPNSYGTRTVRISIYTAAE
jgi:hypothetical protein